MIVSVIQGRALLQVMMVRDFCNIGNFTGYEQKTARYFDYSALVLPQRVKVQKTFYLDWRLAIQKQVHRAAYRFR